MAEKKVLFVSFWTSKYKEAAARLKASLDRFGCESDIQEIEEKGWTGAVRYKPTFILQMLEKHPEADAVVWIDADGDVVAKPTLFWDIEEDLGVAFYHWFSKNVDELLSGTMYWKNSQHVRQAIDTWISKLAGADQKLTTPEQTVLQEILPELELSVHRLPDAYCRILKDRGRGGIPKDSVVVHYQFSRECRSGGSPPPIVKMATSTPDGRPVKMKLRERRDKELAVRNGNRQGKLHPHLQSRAKPVSKPSITPVPIALTVRRKDIYLTRKMASRLAVQGKTGVEAMLSKEEKESRRRRMLKLLERRLGGQAARDGALMGGVVGYKVDEEEIEAARLALADVKSASLLDGCIPDGVTVVIMGNSPTISLIQPSVLEKMPTIGCNRALKYDTFWPDVLVIADREPYCQERDAGRLASAAKAGVKMLLSDSIFDPSVLLRGPLSNMHRRAQAVPNFPFYLYKIGPRKKTWTYDDVAKGKVKLPINVSSFDMPLCSCQNVAGSMLQAAAILGARRIAIIGIEMRWESQQTSHFFGSGSDVGAYPQDAALDKILASLRQIKEKFDRIGIEVINLSPIRGAPFSTVFGHYSIDKFLDEVPSMKPWKSKESMNVLTTMEEAASEEKQNEPNTITPSVVTDVEAAVEGP